MTGKNILIINGSASSNSSNERLIDVIAALLQPIATVSLYNELKQLPHFDPELSANNPPAAIVQLRAAIEEADGVIICTPEYIFSIPSGLKNAIEWCVATTIWENKPTGLITASASGVKGHEELQLVMKTVSALFTPATTLLIQGIKGKVSLTGQIIHQPTQLAINQFIQAFIPLALSSNTTANMKHTNT